MCSIYGSAYEMYYTNAKSNVAIAYVSPIEAFMVYDDSVLENPMFFIRYYTDSKNVGNKAAILMRRSSGIFA